MVLFNAGKMSRNAAALVNRANCGGPKKAGLSPRQGFYITAWSGRLPRSSNSMPVLCRPDRTIGTQNYGYRGVRVNMKP